MENTLQGIYVTTLGMGLLFVALGVLLVGINLLTRAFPEKAQEPEPDVLEATIATEPTDEGRVAAMAVALALMERDSQVSTVAAPLDESGPSPWVILGRQTVMASRQGH